MEKKIFPDYSSMDPIKKLTLGGIGSFLLMLMLPKSIKFFIRHGFAGIAKNIVVIFIAGLLSQKAVNWIVQNEPTPPQQPTE